MNYRKLGKTGMVVSELALGTMYFGDETPEADAFALLDGFVEAGGTLIDTSDVYVGSVAEQVIGRWRAARPHDLTDRVVQATKGRFSASPDPNDQGLSRRHLSRALDASRKRLGVDTIDLYQLHASDMQTPVEETLSFLDAAVRAGKIHYVGLSNFTGWQLQLLASTAQAMGVPAPASIQSQYSLLSREIEWEIVPCALHNNLSLLPWSPLAGGFLAGKYQRGSTPAADTRAGSQKELYQWTSADYAKSDQNWRTIDEVVRIAQAIGATPTQVALKWLSDRPGVAAPIFGARTVAQLHENLAATKLVLSPEDTQALEAVSAPHAGGYPYGRFGEWQRERWLHDGTPAPVPVMAGGSEHPLG